MLESEGPRRILYRGEIPLQISIGSSSCKSLEENAGKRYQRRHGYLSFVRQAIAAHTGAILAVKAQIIR